MCTQVFVAVSLGQTDGQPLCFVFLSGRFPSLLPQKRRMRWPLAGLSPGIFECRSLVAHRRQSRSSRDARGCDTLSSCRCWAASSATEFWGQGKYISSTLWEFGVGIFPSPGFSGSGCGFEMPLLKSRTVGTCIKERRREKLFELGFKHCFKLILSRPWGANTTLQFSPLPYSSCYMYTNKNNPNITGAGSSLLLGHFQMQLSVARWLCWKIIPAGSGTCWAGCWEGSEWNFNNISWTSTSRVRRKPLHFPSSGHQRHQLKHAKK